MAGSNQKASRGKKIGRAMKKPSHARYNIEHRWEINKNRRIRKQKRFEEKKKAKKLLREAEEK